jgi:predicted nucleotide-binding protein
MAKGRTPAPPPSRTLSGADKRAAVTRLEARIKDIEAIDTSRLQSGDDPAVQSVEARIKSTLASLFGEGSAEYRRLELATNLDATAYVLRLDGRPMPPPEIQQGVARGKQRAIATLQGEVDALRESLEFDATAPNTDASSSTTAAAASDDVFVVHGRDDPAKTEVARLIERAGLHAVILHEQPNQGRTVAEKLADHGGAAGFAVVILTPDDVGGTDKDHLQPRARQNVVGELFWFAGKLGRSRVCALMKGKVEIPSDFAGVVYTDMDDRGAWKGELLRELSAAGYTVNWARAMA